MPFSLVAAAPVAAAGGPLAPLILGGLGAANLGGLLWKLFSGGGKDAPPPTPTNPITGQPVPIDPNTGQVWALDTQSGLPHELTSQLWNLSPEGAQFGGLTPDNFIQQGMPFWAANRFREMADQLGGWDNLTKWLYDRTNWSTVLQIMRNPWGQSSYDTLPEGATVEQASTTPNEGQTVETPEGTPSSGGTPDTPNFPTTVTGSSGGWPDWAGPAVGAGAAAAGGFGLGSILNGPEPPPQLAQIDAQGNPVFSTTVTGSPINPTPTPSPTPSVVPGSPDPIFTGGLPGEQPGGFDQFGRPVFSTTVTGQAPTLSTGPSTYGGPDFQLPPGLQLPTVSLPNGTPTPNPVPGVDTPPSTGASSPNIPPIPGLGTGGGGLPSAVVPPAYPQLPALPPIASLFGPSAPAPFVPGISRLFGGR